MIDEEYEDEDRSEIQCFACGHEQELSELRDGCCVACDAPVEAW